jgi:4'-phosphopantetheinyl transferase
MSAETLVRLACLNEAPRWREKLTPGERARAEAIRNDANRARFVVSRGLRRELLAQCTGRPAGELEFVEDGGSKPRLAAGLTWDFNVSHAGDHVAVAARERPVGIDIEVVRGVSDMAAIVGRYFHADEAAAWRGMDDAERVAGFFVLWSAREAAMKCAGLGLAKGMAVTRVDPVILQTDEAAAVAGGGVVRLRRLNAPPGCVLMLALG